MTALSRPADGLLDTARARAVRGLRLRERVVTAVLGLGFAAVAVPLALDATSDRSPSLWLVALLVGSYAAASRIELEVGGALAVPTQLALVPMLFLVPVAKVPACVALGLVLGSLPDVRRGALPPERLAVLLTRAWHALGPTAVLLAAGQPGPEWAKWPVFAGALAAQFGVDLVARSLRGGLGSGISPLEQLRWLPAVYAFDAGLAPVGFLVAREAERDAWSAVALAPLLATIALVARLRPPRPAALVHDALPGDAVWLSLAVADELGLRGRDRRDVELTALLHDVGRTTIPTEILDKPGPLTDAEWAVVQRHTVEGEKLLVRLGGRLGEVGGFVRSCHERWNGSGYPDGLRGVDIPLVARIVAAADAYEAMRSERSYRPALTSREAVEELRRNAGTQFDPQVVEALLRRI